MIYFTMKFITTRILSDNIYIMLNIALVRRIPTVIKG